MALAATLASSGMRPASFLPAIKCSNCGEEIEIASIGDHICRKAPPSPKAQPASLSNPFTLRQLYASGHMPHAPTAPSPLQNSQPLPQTRVRSPSATLKSMPAPKPSRTAPARINPDAANRPFLAPIPPRSASPLSPAISVRSGSSNDSRPPMVRSMTSPMPRIFDPRPPSPEMSGNLDCAFPPFPPPTPGSVSGSGSGSRPGTSNGRKTPNGSERAPSRGGSRQDGGMSSGGDMFVRGPDNGKNGPLDGRQRRPSAQELPPVDRRRPSLSSINFSRGPPPVPTEPVPRPSTSHSNRAQIPPATTMPPFNAPSDQVPPQKRGPPPRPERPTEDVLSPRFLDNLHAEPVMEIPSTFSLSDPPVPLRSADRSRTFPMRQGSGDEPANSHTLAKTPSEPQLRGRERRPTLTPAAKSEPFHVPQVHNRARSQSRGAPRMDQRLQNAPPVPKPVQQYRQEPMHAPSESASSTASSAHSVGNTNSSGPSPVTSAASSVDAFSPLSYNAQQYGEDERMRVTALNIKSQQKPGMRAEQPAQRSPPKNFARLSPPNQDAPPLEREPTLPALSSPPLESPMDPAMRTLRSSPVQYEPWQPPQTHQRRPTLSRAHTTPEPAQAQLIPAPPPPMPSLAVSPPPSSEYDPYRPASPQPHVRANSKSNPAPQYKAYSAGASVRPLSPQPVPRPPPVPQEVSRAQAPARRGTVAKPMCRGCGLVIEGKSVKAADGRLTGRWHKACFTCRACNQPFTTADFYVIANHPYCEQHYHEKNGSLCHGCNRGIEGQYLETTSSSTTSGSVDKKFHPRCFTCHDCHIVLSDDYFEIVGKVYCERHALAAMRGQARMAGPGLNPPDKRALTAERRTTKLMMM